MTPHRQCAWDSCSEVPVEGATAGASLRAAVAAAAGIIGGLLSYIVINGANFLLDKLAECMHWSIAGTDTQPAASCSFISRLQSNTGGAAQVRAHSRPHGPPLPEALASLQLEMASQRLMSLASQCRRGALGTRHGRHPCAFMVLAEIWAG